MKKSYPLFIALLIIGMLGVGCFFSFLGFDFSIIISFALLVPLAFAFAKSDSLSVRHVVVTINKKRMHLFFKIIWAFSLILIIFLPDASLSASDWSIIPPLYLIAGIAAIPLCIFYPGYSLLHLASLDREFSKLESILLSVIISQLIVGGIGFIATFLPPFSLTALAILSVLSLSLLLITTLKDVGVVYKKEVATLKIDAFESCVWGVLLIIVSIGFFAVNYPLNMVPTIDQWYHFGVAVRATDDALFLRYPAYYWNSLFDGVYLVTNPLPYANAYALLLPLGLIGIPAFYCLSLRMLDKQTALFSTTAYSLLSGMGGFYGIILQIISEESLIRTAFLTGVKSADGWVGNMSYPLYYFPKSIGMAALFIFLIVLLKARNEKNLFKFGLLLFSVVTLGYLWHMLEILYLLFVLPFLVVFVFKDKASRSALFFGLGLMIVVVGVIDTIAPINVYALSLTGTISTLATIGIIGVFLFILVVTLLGLELPSVLYENEKIVMSTVWLVSAILLFAAVYEQVVWLSSWDSIYIFNYSGILPLFLYPSKLGLILIVALLSYFIVDVNRNRIPFLIATIAAIIAFALARFSAWYLLSYSTIIFPESRLVEFMWPWLVIIASIALVKIVHVSTKTNGARERSIKLTLVTLLILGILIIGYSSKAYEIEVRRAPNYTLSASEVNDISVVSDLGYNASIMAGGVVINALRDFSSALTFDSYSDYVLFSNNVFEIATILQNNPYSIAGQYPHYYASLDNPVFALNGYEDSYFLSSIQDRLEIISNTSMDLHRVPVFYPPVQDSDQYTLLIETPIDERLAVSLTGEDVNDFEFGNSKNLAEGSYALQNSDGVLDLVAQCANESDEWVYYTYDLSNLSLDARDCVMEITFQTTSSASISVYFEDVGYAVSPQTRESWTTEKICLNEIGSGLLTKMRLACDDFPSNTSSTQHAYVQNLRIITGGAECQPRSNEERSHNLFMEILAMGPNSYDISYDTCISSDLDSEVIFVFEAVENPYLFDWVADGGNLCIVNTTGWENTVGPETRYDRISDAANYLSFNGEIPSSSQYNNSLESLYWFSSKGTNIYPLLQQESLGSGKILYFNIWPIIGSILNNTPSQDIRQQYSQLGVLMDYLDFQVDGVFEASYSPVAVCGGSIESSGIIVVETEVLNIENRFEITENLDEIGVIAGSLLDEIVSMGDVSFEIIGEDFSIDASSAYYGVRISPGDAILLSITIGAEGRALIQYDDEEGRKEVEIDQGEYTFALSPNNELSQIHCLFPRVMINGTATFEKIYESSSFGIYSRGDTLIISGQVLFDVVMSGKYLEITNLSWTGDYERQGDELQTRVDSVYQIAHTNPFFIPYLIIGCVFYMVFIIPNIIRWKNFIIR